MNSVSFISAIYGKYEFVKSPVTQVDVVVDEWVLVTDEPEIEAPGWRVVVEPRPHLHPNVAAKIPKFRPDLYVSSPNSIWIDASSIVQPSLAFATLLALEHSWTMAMFPHPNRSRISDEVTASRGLPKYDDLPLEKQVQHYFDNGYPDGHSLWASGVIGRSAANRELDAEIGDEWLFEVSRWGFQDQLSLPYILWKHNAQPAKIGTDLWANPHIWFGNHGR